MSSKSCRGCPVASPLSALLIYGGTALAALTAYHIHQQLNKKNYEKDIPKELLSQDGKYNEELKLAVKLAIEGGNNMVRHCESKGTSSENSAELLGDFNIKQNEADFATKIDHLNEELISSAISARFPSHKIIGEESTGTGSPEPLTQHPTWIIDPIDGTTNFASGLPLTCVSIGMCDGGEPVLGVVYSPQTRELYAALKGRGAFRNGVRIRCDANASKTLSDSVVCFEFGSTRGKDKVQKMITGAQRIMEHGCRSTRSFGSGVLDLCYVAAGRLDVVYTGVSDEGWKPWDYCAGMVVAEEAGCTIRSLLGNPSGAKEFDEKGCVVKGTKFDIYSKSMICGVSDKLVEECRRVLFGLSSS